MRFLLDANLSPETAEFLRRHFSFDASSLIEAGIAGLKDDEIATIADKENRNIITLDLDFGKIYHESPENRFGVTIIRTRDQRIEHVNELLKKFFLSGQGEKIFSYNPNALVVIEDTLIRTVNLGK